MKKVILIFTMLFFPIIVSAGETVKIKCKSSEIKKGDVITCEVKTNTSKVINAISADLRLSNNLELVEITKNKIFEGDANGGDIDLYLGYDLIIPVEIVEIKIKLLNDNNETAYVNVENIVYTDNKFQDVPGENASLMLKVIKQKVTTTTVPTTTAPVTTIPKTTTRTPEITRTTTRTTKSNKSTTKKISIPEIPNIEYTTESKKEETTKTTTRKFTTRNKVTTTTTKVNDKKFLDINISDNFLIYLILLILSFITYKLIISYVRKQKQ